MIFSTRSSINFLSATTIKRIGINSFLVDDNERLRLVVTANLLLQRNDLLHAVLDKLPLSHDQLLPLFGRLVEEARIDFSLLILQRHIAGENVAILQTFRHVRMTTTMVHY